MEIIDGLRAYYKLDETSGNAVDSSGNGYTLVNTNGVTFSAGKINNGADDGAGNTTKKLSIADNLGIAGGAITISGWVKLNSEPGVGVTRMFFSQTDATTDSDVYLTYINQAGTYKINAARHLYGVSDTSVTATVAAFGTSSYHHIVLTYDTTTLRLYCDNVFMGSIAASGSGISAAISSFDIGYNPRFASYGESKYDEVGVWNRALSVDEIAILWNNGNAVQSPFTIETNAVTNISLTTAVGNGEVLSDSGATITERGVVWSTSPNPTTSNGKSTAAGTIGVFTANMSGLISNTTYYVRAFYTNSLGTTYGEEVSFTTLNIGQYELQKDIDATEGQEFVGQINVTGTIGTITVKLGSLGTETVINAGAGDSAFSGTYSGLSGLIITRSADFDGTVDNIYYAQVTIGTTVDWSLDSITIVSAIDSSVFFKRIEDDVFNSFRFYRYLDLLFKDLDGYVTVTVRDEREDITTERDKIFSVGNVSTGTVSPFQKKRISFLIKPQAVIIGLSNGNKNETFSIAKFILSGHKKPEKMFSPSKINSIG